MTYKVEFKHYDDTLILPEGWIDTSWHNDICPSFEKDVRDITFRLWCDFKDPELREVGGKRFTVNHYENEDELDDSNHQFDTMEEALAFINGVTA